MPGLKMKGGMRDVDHDHEFSTENNNTPFLYLQAISDHDRMSGICFCVRQDDRLLY
jgi:hypothetical protein